ncbi:MAG: tyrosine-protein kinase family protein [Terriglobia bacterium]
MSKIHEAMQRAEKEGLATGVFPSGARERSHHGAIASRESSSSLTIPDLVPPEKGNRPVVPAFNGLSGLIEKRTVPASRLVALWNGTYDGLRESLRRKKAQARASGSDLKAILFTSVGVGDGKSLTTANVSISISKELGERVLLVDANLRTPSIHRWLGIDQGHGLSEVLQGTVAADQAISRTDISDFYVVTAGNRVDNPTELLNTRKMSDFLAFAKKYFDWVFVDSPSLMPEPDADLTSSMVDGVVLVARSSRSSTTLLRDGIQMLQGRNVLGVVLNDVDASNGPLGAFQQRQNVQSSL